MKPSLSLFSFALLDTIQESAEFIPFDLLYGHEVNELIGMIKERWLGRADPPNVTKYMSEFKNWLMRARGVTPKNLRDSQTELKSWYDKRARARAFLPKGKV